MNQVGSAAKRQMNQSAVPAQTKLRNNGVSDWTVGHLAVLPNGFMPFRKKSIVSSTEIFVEYSSNNLVK